MTTVTTTSTTTYTGPTVAEMADDRVRTLRRRNLSEHTIKIYSTTTRQLVDYLTAHGMPTVVEHVTREHVESFLEDVLTTRSAATARIRHGSLRAFFGWLIDEGEITRSPMERVRPPFVPQPTTPVVALDDLRRLIKTCEADKTFTGRRDAAIVRMFADTGLRLAELADLKLDDIDDDRTLYVRSGKGRKARTADLSDSTVLALRRYMRARSRHPHADSDWLWVGRSGRYGRQGIRSMLPERGAAAGIDGLHAHQLRHTMADAWLADGGSEGDLMKLAGWSNRAMLARYGSANAEARARQAHRTYGLGNKL